MVSYLHVYSLSVYLLKNCVLKIIHVSYWRPCKGRVGKYNGAIKFGGKGDFYSVTKSYLVHRFSLKIVLVLAMERLYSQTLFVPAHNAVGTKKKCPYYGMFLLSWLILSKMYRVGLATQLSVVISVYIDKVASLSRVPLYLCVLNTTEDSRE